MAGFAFGRGRRPLEGLRIAWMGERFALRRPGIRSTQPHSPLSCALAATVRQHMERSSECLTVGSTGMDGFPPLGALSASEWRALRLAECITA